MIYFSSDLHLCHNKSFIYEPRGCSNVEDMNAEILTAAKALDQQDTLYLLGDLMLNDDDTACEILRQFPCQVKVIRGNHDGDQRIKKYKEIFGLEEIPYADIIKYGKWRFYLSHFPTKVGNYDDEESHKKFYCLCGHAHTQDRWKDFSDKCYHVELDAHNMKFISIEDIIADIKKHEQHQVEEIWRWALDT
jgi:calcineurin-like phosphoesterase family protein